MKGRKENYGEKRRKQRRERIKEGSKYDSLQGGERIELLNNMAVLRKSTSRFMLKR